jgi:hypothetical protein
VLGVAGTILLLSFLWSAYQAFSSGSDVRMFAVSGIGYLVLGLVFVDYGNIFRGVNSMFNSVADYDGMLRAYANRAMVLAFIFGAIALASLGFAHLCPPATTDSHSGRQGRECDRGGSRRPRHARKICPIGAGSSRSGTYRP